MASNSLIWQASCEGSTCTVVETVVDLVGIIGEEVVNCGSGGVGSGPVLDPENK